MNPVITVQVGTYVSGVVQERFCDYNTAVKKGQLCAKIDPRLYEPVVEQNAANLAVAKAQLDKDLAGLAYAKATYDRNLTLLAKQAVSQDAVDSLKSLYDQAAAQVALDQANISLRAAELKEANVNLDYTNIRSPVSRLHRVRPGTARDFDIRNLSQIAETAENSGRVFARLLAAVASISLVVGGIGIMNILLVSVTERTREIGLRMAIGARRLYVLLQFLAEAVFMSVAGGVAGILIGIFVSKAISLITGWQTPISLVAVGIRFLFSAVVGIFGFYPARKAANFDPIQALRYE